MPSPDSKRDLPAELRHPVPEPALILFGCTPHVPHPTRRDGAWDPETCPVCKGTIGYAVVAPTVGRAFGRLPIFDRPPYLVRRPPDHLAHRTYCARCDAFSLPIEAAIQAQRQDAMLHARAVARHERAEQAYRDRLADRIKDPDRTEHLTECERRRIWTGYAGAINRRPGEAEPEPTNRAKLGRDWLRAIGQEPDWFLILDRRGRAVGRWVEAVADDGTPLRTDAGQAVYVAEIDADAPAEPAAVAVAT